MKEFCLLCPLAAATEKDDVNIDDAHYARYSRYDRREYIPTVT